MENPSRSRTGCNKLAEKVYVAIGRDSYDGFSTLQWTLTKWSSISIVILYGPSQPFPKDYVYTPLGKLHVSSVSEEKLNALEKAEEAKSDKLLSQYLAYCRNKAKAEVIKLERNEPLDEQMIEIISNLRITKLVLSFGFIKSSSLKSRTAISRSFYILRHKPEFCEVFVICGGRLVFLRDVDDEGGIVEDDREVTVASIKERSNSIKAWIGRMFPENVDLASSSKADDGVVNQWMKFGQEIEQYADELISLHDEEGDVVGSDNRTSIDLHMPQVMDAAERLESIQSQIRKAEEAIESNKERVHVAKERGEKARWAVGICHARAEELEACLNSEAVKTADLSKELESRKEEVNELRCEVEEKRKKLSSILELQKELSDRLHLSSSAKARAEVQLDKAVRIRSNMVHEIDELRKHRQVLKCRIEFCREKDAIGKASKFDNGIAFDFREFSAPEIFAATEDFSERLRMKSTSRLTTVYKGRLNGTTVAIKVYNQANVRSFESYASMVKYANKLRHPNIVAVIGFCSELDCIVYEYMHNRSLHDVLFSGEKSQPYNWHVRIRIASEVCSALAFLHKAKPEPVVHGNIKASKILLDRYQGAKINILKNPRRENELDISMDIREFGNILVQLLTGKNWEIGMGSDSDNGDFLDHLDGEWPMDLAVELYGIAMRCLSTVTEIPVEEIDGVTKRADELLVEGQYEPLEHQSIHVEEMGDVPSAFLCPIYQDVMRNPYLASDGFSYEFEAIDEWLKSGHDTSPMTNLRLKHKLLTPNRVLRSLIQDWRNKRSAAWRRQ
ncbi:putative U-box domain-containing protein 50 [Andrographis paniculata]|uniref:putative U-box domain-containing protein 50 n=1 Tax=Andrographis paniculata TaxID=175694 RepID=UPI0021E96C4E|nr:putative U-box domain-containing protein 50 [Andrographis paniculata]